MAISVQTSGSTAMVVATPQTLATISTAGVYQFSCDSNPLTGFLELLILIVEQKTLTGSTRREEDRFVIARGTDGGKIKFDIPRVSEFELVYKLLQEGGTARTIDWRVDKLE